MFNSALSLLKKLSIAATTVHLHHTLLIASAKHSTCLQKSHGSLLRRSRRGHQIIIIIIAERPDQACEPTCKLPSSTPTITVIIITRTKLIYDLCMLSNWCWMMDNISTVKCLIPKKWPTCRYYIKWWHAMPQLLFAGKVRPKMLWQTAKPFTYKISRQYLSTHYAICFAYKYHQ